MIRLRARHAPDGSGADFTRVNDLSRTARAAWFGLLAYLAFSGVTLLGVTDVDFFLDSRQTQLPLIGVAIPTRDFFLFGPILGTALYVYLHLYLLKLWEALRDLPPRPGNEPLSIQVSPWLISDFALAIRGQGAARKRPLGWLSHLVTALLVFAAGPLVIGYFWLRYWPAHELGISLINAGLLVLAGVVMLSSLWVAITRLRYGHRYLGGWRFLVACLLSLLIALPVGLLTLLKTGGAERLGLRSEYVFDIEKRVRFGPDPGNDSQHHLFWSDAVKARLADWGFPQSVHNADLQRLPGLSLVPLGIAQARMDEADLTQTGADWQPYFSARRSFRTEWCANQGLSPELCGPDARYSDDSSPRMSSLRAKWCEDAPDMPDAKRPTTADCIRYFNDLNLRFANDWEEEYVNRVSGLSTWIPKNKDLRYADLIDADLIGADLREAQIHSALLVGANMQAANLWRAELPGAFLDEASLQHARMTEANLQRAYLLGADLYRADLLGAKLQGADLTGAVLVEANLREAKLNGAKLSYADLTGANL